MRQKSDKRTKRQERYMKFSEDHIQFLDDIRGTIREMIDAELDRRGVSPDGNPHPENPPPKHAKREPPTREPPHRSLWQRLVSLFSFCL